MAEPVSTISCVASVFIRQMLFEKNGDVNEGHAHVFDHQTLLARGSIKAVVDGHTSYFTAPQIIFIKAGILHEFTAMEDNTLCYCIHALRDGDDVCDIIDPEGVPQGINPGDIFSVAKPLIQTN
jgi:hypothetical protein